MAHGLRIPAFATVVLAIAALLAACGPDGRRDATDSPTSAELVGSGVGIRADGCGGLPRFGSGVAVVRSGLVATVAHTIAGAEDITVIDPAGNLHVGSAVAFDPDADLAVVAAPTLAAAPLPLGQVATGPATTLRWSADDGVSAEDARITQRLAITIDDIYGVRRVERSGMELAADVVVGDSGGPVIDPDGAVVGVVYANSRSRPGVGFATDVDELRPLLDTIIEQIDELGGDPTGLAVVDVGPCR